MTTAARESAVAGAIVRAHGQMARFVRAGTTAGVDLAVVITRQTDPLWGGGEVGVREQHYAGYLKVAALAHPPALGDALEVDGQRYEIDQAPVQTYGLWSLVLRKCG